MLFWYFLLSKNNEIYPRDHLGQRRVRHCLSHTTGLYKVYSVSLCMPSYLGPADETSYTTLKKKKKTFLKDYEKSITLCYLENLGRLFSFGKCHKRDVSHENLTDRQTVAWGGVASGNSYGTELGARTSNYETPRKKAEVAQTKNIPKAIMKVEWKEEIE